MKFIYEEIKSYDETTCGTTLVIWGAGNIGSDLLKTLENKHIKIDYFCDNNVIKNNKIIQGVLCISPKELLKIEGNIKIFIAVNNDLKPGLISQIQKYNKDWDIYINFLTDEGLLADKLIAQYESDSVVLKNIKSKYINVVDNIRMTEGQPELFENVIYIFGDSRLIGGITPDSNTICSILQRKIIKNNLFYKVENYASIGDCIYSQINKIKNLN